jgi:predicted Zn-dependent protease
MSEILWLEGKKYESKEILKRILSIYPDNNAISHQLFYFNIKDQEDLEQSISGIEYLMKYNSNNPQAYKILAEAYNKTNRFYKSKLALINYYNLKGNIPMAFKVIDDGTSSDKLSKYEKEYLKKLKNSILCASNPPLEPIFGDKTCN